MGQYLSFLKKMYIAAHYKAQEHAYFSSMRNLTIMKLMILSAYFKEKFINMVSYHLVDGESNAAIPEGSWTPPQEILPAHLIFVLSSALPGSTGGVILCVWSLIAQEGYLPEFCELLATLSSHLKRIFSIVTKRKNL